MRQRIDCPQGSLGMDQELLDLLKLHLDTLAKIHRITGIVTLPSRTWQARNDVAAFLAMHLQVPIFDLLFWKEPPKKRQGELLNNNQRHENVHQHMQVNTRIRVPQGTLILLDDYIGSGNTLKEAARALRSQSILNELVPFTIATVKWRLGKQGFV